MHSLKNSGSAYGPLSKFLHWVIAFLVILMLAGSYFISDIPDKMLKGIVFNAHKLIGLSILLLMLIRLVWALMNPKPVSMPGTKAWERFAERAAHYLFYVALIAMPIAGWVGTIAGGHPPKLGPLAFNLPIEKNEALDDLCFSIHNNLAIFIIALVSLHALAALYHYFYKKDTVMQRMWP